MPFSVKRTTHAFLQHKKKFIYNKRDLRTLPFPFKRTCKQKIQVQVKLQKNCTKPKKRKQKKPQPFRVLLAGDKEIHTWWRVLSYVLLQTPRNSNVFDTFCLHWLCSESLPWPSDRQPTQPHGLLSQIPPELEELTVQSTLGPRRLRHTLLCSFFNPLTLWSLGQVVTYLRAVLRGGHGVGRTRGEAPVLPGIGAFV